MTVVDPVYAQYLMSQTLWAVASDDAAATRWGATAAIKERRTTIATKADAEAEAARQLAFMAGPLVMDEHVLLGQWVRYRGQVVTITGNKLGYDAGAEVFVLGAQDALATGTSVVTVLRRL